MMENNFMVDNLTNLPEGLVLKKEINNLSVEVLSNIISFKYGQPEYIKNSKLS